MQMTYFKEDVSDEVQCQTSQILVSSYTVLVVPLSRLKASLTYSYADL